ncbi:MAG: isocitrate lyase/phosphoenolpyruvate mutase family protein [Bacteriovoracaceae bacterium]|nr:isocitrate lyase/phosphoenolpyruvate mutase family protein [Bacteriovoracaceae bacterium]
MLKAKQSLTFIGSHNPFIAKLVERAGFGGVYISGAGLSNSLGLPDTGILKLDDFVYMAKHITKATSLPVICDADTGFDDIEATVEQYIKAGLSALHIEDQVFPKRCGHLDGKEVIDAKLMCQKIQKATSVRDKLSKDFLIIARTDARGATNVESDQQFSESLDRGKQYLQAGADIIFPESMRTEDEFRQYRAGVDSFLLANMTEFGKSPFIAHQDFAKMGYQIVIFPVTIFRYLAGQVDGALEAIMQDGNQRNLIDAMMNRLEVNKILKYDPKN